MRARALLKRQVTRRVAVQGVTSAKSAAKKIASKKSAPSRDFLIGNPPAGTTNVIRTFPPDPIDRVAKPAPIRSPEVSIWSSLGQSISKGIAGGIQQKIAGPSKIVAGPAIMAGAAAAGRVLPAIGRVLTGRVATAATAGVLVGGLIADGRGGGGCPPGFHPNKQDGVGGAAGTYCVRNRRMNVGNARAARRSVRRLKGARKLLQDIEKMMPRRPAPRAKQHHHHPAAGG